MTRVSREKRVEFTIKAGSPENSRATASLSAVRRQRSDRIRQRSSTRLPTAPSLPCSPAAVELDDKVGATLMLHDLPGVARTRVLLLVSLGKADELTDKSTMMPLRGAKQLAGSVAADAAFILTEARTAPLRSRLASRPGRADPQDSTYRCDELKARGIEERREEGRLHRQGHTARSAASAPPRLRHRRRHGPR